MIASIYIPTYGRPQQQKTFQRLHEKIQQRVIFIIKPEEEKEMLSLWGDKCKKLLIVDKSGVAVARQKAIEDSVSDHILFFDDDLRFDKRIQHWNYKNNNRAVIATPDQTLKAIQWMEEELKKTALVCLGARGGNNRHTQRWTIQNSRVMRSFGVKRSVMDLLGVSFDDFYYWEDFHIALTFLEYGYPNVVNVDYITDAGLSNSPGGVSRHIKRMWYQAKKFQRVHPTARVREKTFKNGSTVIQVPDFTIGWKKSFRSKI